MHVAGDGRLRRMNDVTLDGVLPRRPASSALTLLLKGAKKKNKEKNKKQQRNQNSNGSSWISPDEMRVRRAISIYEEKEWQMTRGGTPRYLGSLIYVHCAVLYRP